MSTQNLESSYPSPSTTCVDIPDPDTPIRNTWNLQPLHIALVQHDRFTAEQLSASIVFQPVRPTPVIDQPGRDLPFTNQHPPAIHLLVPPTIADNSDHRISIAYTHPDGYTRFISIFTAINLHSDITVALATDYDRPIGPYANDVCCRIEVDPDLSQRPVAPRPSSPRREPHEYDGPDTGYSDGES